MVVVFAKCTVETGKEKNFLDLTHELADKSRKESANVSYDILKETDKSDNEYCFLEKWNDKSGLDEHMATDHFKNIIAEVQKIIVGELEIHIYQTV